MTSREQVVAIDIDGDRLAGIVSEPSAVGGDLGVVIVVGGPQYRAGSHRQFVLLARHIAEAGFPTLRFDVRGMGDSTGAQRSFENIRADIGAAITAFLQARKELRRVVIWGLCDGASAALMYVDAAADNRVTGLALANPWVRSVQSLARTEIRHYYLQRMTHPSFWRKLLSGQVGLSAALGWVHSLARACTPAGQDAESGLAFQLQMARGWRSFAGPKLLLLSGNDLTAKEFVDLSATDPLWREALAHPSVSRHDLVDADHTWSTQRHRMEVEMTTTMWLTGVANAAPNQISRFEQIICQTGSSPVSTQATSAFKQAINSETR